MGGPYERSISQVCHRRHQFFPCVHNNGSVPGDRFLDRGNGYEQEPYTMLTSLHNNFVTGSKFNQGAVARQITDIDLFSGHFLFQQLHAAV